MVSGSNRTAHYLPMRNLILRTLALSGGLALAAVAPKTLQLIKKLDRGAAQRAQLHRQIRQTLSRLEHSGLVRRTKPGDFRVEITEKGQRYVDAAYASEYQIVEPAFWDGKWRIVMFDMREKRRSARFRLRLLLRNAGFVRLQDSVWVYPYPCDEFIALLRAHLKSGTGELLCLTAEALESDRHLREHFRLA